MLGFAEVEPARGARRARALGGERRDPGPPPVRGRAGGPAATGHVAVVVRDYDEVVARLRDAGHEAAPRAEHFGAPRTQVRTPAGHLVEIMAPPRP